MKVLVFFLCTLTILQVSGQVNITGKVTDKKGEPLLGVNVYVDGTYDGATTDMEGWFSFQTYETDSLVLVTSFIGYHKSQRLLAAMDQHVQVEMREEINELNAVAITAGAFDASDEGKREVLKPLDIVTTAGATADIPGALNTLPGTQAVGETGRLFVRGGDGRETKTFIDGMLVHNEYSPSAPNTPGRNRFSPFMFKGMSFSTGGYSAEYGQALSSALILNSKDVAENNRTDISLMSVGADVASTRSLKNGSVAGKVQYTNLTPYFGLLSQRLNWDKAPEEFNGNFAYRWKTSKTGMLKVYSNLSTSDMQLYETDIANPEVELPVVVTNDYAHFNTSYRELINDRLGVRTGVSITRSDDFAALDEASREQNLTGYHGKFAFDYQQSDRLAFVAGGELIGTDVEQLLFDSTSFQQAFNERISASFVETELFASSSLAFKMGLRAEYNDLVRDLFLTPRISGAYKTGEHSQVSVAFGQFRQSPATQIVLFDAGATPERATHYIANYQWTNDGQSFRVEAYEKQYDQLTRYTNQFDPRTYRFNGDGHARGLDVFWRDSKTFKNMDYWVSYSFLATKRDYRDFPGSFIPSFASAHNFSAVTKKFISEIKSQIGLTYSFASPRRYNDPNDDGFMTGKTRSYHDLSFNISYLYNSQIIFHALVNNVLGADNVFGYEFADRPNENGVYPSRPITQPAKRFIFLGVFFTLSKYKGINQLPNL